MTLRLGPGTYHIVGSYPSDASVKKLVNTYVVERGFDYTSCLHITEERPLLDPLVPLEPLAPRVPR